MLDLSMGKVLLILVVALIVFGPKQVAETARVLGRLYRDLQKMVQEARQSIDLETLGSSFSGNEKRTSGTSHDQAHDQQPETGSTPRPGEQ